MSEGVEILNATNDALNATNATSTELTPDLFVAYSAIVTMALVPIYIGSYLSLQRKNNKEQPQEEAMTKKDAYMFPIFGSGVLFGLYILFRVFSKEYVNLLLTAYSLFFGFLSLAQTYVPVIKKFSPVLSKSASRTFKYRLPWEKDQNTITFNHADVVSWFLSFISILWYISTKNWLANNLIGLSFSVQGVSIISLGSYQVGCILLGGLFIYDIFWVFGTDVMVTVAKSFDAPIKLLFPKSLFAEKYSFSMLGLGDIVIPGVFIALLLRYDAHRAKSRRSNFKAPYFRTTFAGYALGLMTTIYVMHTFQAAQPALLYLVPACIGFSSVQAVLLGDLKGLYNFEEKEEEKTKGKKKESNKEVIPSV